MSNQSTVDLQAPPSPTGSVNSWSPKIKSRWRFSSAETSVLESVYEEDRNPTRSKMEALVLQLRCPMRTVTTWFQNKRAKEKRRMKARKASSAMSATSFTAASHMTRPSTSSLPKPLIKAESEPFSGSVQESVPEPATVSFQAHLISTQSCTFAPSPCVDYAWTFFTPMEPLPPQPLPAQHAIYHPSAQPIHSANPAHPAHPAHPAEQWDNQTYWYSYSNS